jgi:hypothetical protein
MSFLKADGGRNIPPGARDGALDVALFGLYFVFVIDYLARL